MAHPRHRALRALASLGLLTLPLAAASASDAERDDATILALEETGALHAPPALVAAIEADLQAVRGFDQSVAPIHVLPDWIPGEVLVALDDGARESFDAGSHALNRWSTRLGLESVRVVIDDLNTLLLVFHEPYHPERLAEQASGFPGVVIAEPNGVIGGGDDIEALGDGRYAFRRRWGDCPAGCLHGHTWVFEVRDGRVSLMDEFGDPLPEETPVVRQRWGSIKEAFRPAP